MKSILLSSLMLILTSCSFKSPVVRIYKQWHLSPKVNTSDINKSKTLGQYINQTYIYKHIDTLISKREIGAVISEGCEGEITKNFVPSFNGWTYKKLDSLKESKEFEDIITLAPLKLEVKYKKNLYTVCGDNLKLMKKTLLAFSDLNGFVGYFLRMKQYKGKNKNKYEVYRDSLQKENNKLIKNPIEYSKRKANESLVAFEEYTVLRNEYFVKAIEANLDKNPAIVIGGIHLKDLVKRLEAKKIKYEIISIEGYPENIDKQLDRLRSIIK